ncbi:MAG: radical SAM protein [Candidatus Sumerlaeaceae bacterium]
MITEIYLSIQGESTWAGCPCVFVRLTGCPLRCSYCDTEYAFTGGRRIRLEDVLAEVASFGCPLVEITGGEPLAQPACVELLRILVTHGFTVLLETSGAFSLANVPAEVRKIMDLKCPSSGEAERNLWGNIEFLQPHDEVKFVIGDRTDFEWASKVCREHGLVKRVRAVLFSPVFGKLAPLSLAQWILDERLFDVRLQLQLHKYVWPPEARGV